MSQRKRIMLLSVLAALLFGWLFTAASPVSQVLADVTSDAIDWWVIASGGGKASGGGFTIQDTLGQPIAGDSSNGGLILQAGYWGGVAPEYPLYMPLLRR
jgi:hypothetical protein